MMKHPICLLAGLALMIQFSCAQRHMAKEAPGPQDAAIIPGASRTEVYFPMLKGKRLAVFANNTSMIGNVHLVDSMLHAGLMVKKIFGPEHGFRGDADAGEHVDNAIDKKTGIPVISMYGNHRSPTVDDLKDIDVVVFDIQDVGVRFYTYIGSLEFVMEACLEQHKPLMILDRPNPNGFYVDGPVLDKKFKSFIGMQAVPIVYGMTMGEYGMMLAGENLLSEKANAINRYNITTQPTVDTPFHIQVIKCRNYDHNSKYQLPVMPSPNLKEMQAIYWYPSTCLIEGTVLSEGRGTDHPFLYYGHPTLPNNLFSFTPKPNFGSKSSKCFYQLCYGWNLNSSIPETLKKVDGQIHLFPLLDAYNAFPGKDSFFLKNNFIDRLSGSSTLREQVRSGMNEEQIKATWQPGLDRFKAVRKKYLLYKDFE